MDSLRWVLRFFFILSGLVLAVAGVYGLRSWRLQHGAELTTGTVIGLEKHVWYINTSTLVNYAPRVHFRTQDGQAVEFEAGAGNNPPAWKVGDRIEVLYLRGRPQSAEVCSFWQLWERSIEWGLAGSVLLTVALALQWMVRVAVREEEAAYASGCV